MSENIIEPRHGHRIVAAAIQLKDGRVYCGVRHFDELMRMHLEELPPAGVRDAKQGFVDNKYQFLTREEAWTVAQCAGQIKTDPFPAPTGRLYSEDLW
jgi:hypothetical protein